MTYTTEQQRVIDHVSANEGLTLVSSVAGSGKTTLLVAIAESLKPTNGLYLAYNKAIATEAQRKFPAEVNCCTTHSLAYGPTVKALKLKLGTFTYRNITEPVIYDIKQAVVDYIREFCLSSFTDVHEFGADCSIPKDVVELMSKYLNLMQSGQIECTHDFYLKLFHIMLSQKLTTYQPFDFIALDEAGDLNEVTLAIFNLLPAKRKVMVGDPFQNIYRFNHTINCFEVMQPYGTTLPMTTSFRVIPAIAKRIQTFCRKYLDASFTFEGRAESDDIITTRAFIARTNAVLISRMIELNRKGIPYNLTRTPAQIFSGPLALCALKYKGFISDPAFKFLQHDVDHYFETPSLQTLYKTPLNYCKSMHPDDELLQQTAKLIGRYGRTDIINCYEHARKHLKTNQPLTLGTAHSTKGLEFDEVVIGDDLNNVITNVLDHCPDPSDFDIFARTEFNLYYVACSRAKKRLINATHLDTLFDTCKATISKSLMPSYDAIELTQG